MGLYMSTMAYTEATKGTVSVSTSSSPNHLSWARCSGWARLRRHWAVYNPSSNKAGARLGSRKPREMESTHSITSTSMKPVHHTTRTVSKRGRFIQRPSSATGKRHSNMHKPMR